MVRVSIELSSGTVRNGEMSEASYAHLVSALRGEISAPHRSEGYTLEVGSRRVTFAPSDVSYVKREG